MRLVITRKLIYCAIAGLFLFNGILFGQTYRFSNYGTDSKLPNTFIYTLIQDNDGFLWIGTASSLVKFDGFDFYNVAFTDSVNNRYTAASIKDKNGKLWFGCSDGSVFYVKDNRLEKIPGLNTQSINDLFEGADGFIYIIPQERMIVKINENKPDEITKLYISRSLVMTTASRDLVMTSGCMASPGNMLLGTQENLLLCRMDKDSVVLEKRIEGIEYAKVQVIHPLSGGNKFIIGTETDFIIYRYLVTVT